MTAPFTPSRRAVLLALGAACVRGVPATLGPLDGPLRLGWRWVPGQVLRARVTVERSTDGRFERRIERWSWLVRAVDDDGVAALHGRLEGLGGARSDVPQPALAPVLERERIARSASVRIGTDGRLHPVASRSCDDVGLPLPPCFADQLPHRLLALPLPTHPIEVHDTWPDPELASAFDALLPERVARTQRGTTRVLEIDARERDSATVVLGSVATIRLQEGPTLSIEGQASWDPTRGRLRERTLAAALVGASGADAPGRLTVHLAFDP